MKPSYEELEQMLAESQREFRAADATIENLQMQVEKLAAENTESEKRMQQLIQVINNADNDYCMCGDEMKNHVHGGCGHPTGMFDYHYNQWLKSANETLVTDAFLAEVRAQGVDIAISELNQLAQRSEKEAPIAAEHHRSAALYLQLFAAQLRNGGATEERQSFLSDEDCQAFVKAFAKGSDK